MDYRERIFLNIQAKLIELFLILYILRITNEKYVLWITRDKLPPNSGGIDYMGKIPKITIEWVDMQEYEYEEMRKANS